MAADEPKDIAEALFAEALESQEKRKRAADGEDVDIDVSIEGDGADDGGVDIDVDVGDGAPEGELAEQGGGMTAEQVVAMTELQDELDRVRDQLERVEAARRDNHDKFMRTLAELENFRKRAAKERQEIVRYGHENLARELLGVIDNFERAMMAAPSGEGLDPQVKSFVDGVRMTHVQLLQTLSRFEVKPFDSKGMKFDPARHQAMSRVPAPDVAPDTIVEEMQKGYTLYERLLRPAMVAVATAAEEAPAAPPPAPAAPAEAAPEAAPAAPAATEGSGEDVN